MGLKCMFGLAIWTQNARWHFQIVKFSIWQSFHNLHFGTKKVFFRVFALDPRSNKTKTQAKQVSLLLDIYCLLLKLPLLFFQKSNFNLHLNGKNNSFSAFVRESQILCICQWPFKQRFFCQSQGSWWVCFSFFFIDAQHNRSTMEECVGTMMGRSGLQEGEHDGNRRRWESERKTGMEIYYIYKGKKK